MKVVKPQRLGVLTRTFENDRRFYFVVSGLCFFAFEDPSPLHEVTFWQLAASELGANVPIDHCMPKQRGELLVTGRAFAAGGAPVTVVAPRITLGAPTLSIDKTLWVVGDRRWKLGGVASDPEPFASKAVSWENAFGGDRFSLNPIGKGFGKAELNGKERLLPNVENPKALVKSPSDRPLPAGFGPYDLTWPQRFAKVGTYDGDWLKNRFPGFAKDMDWGIWNTAPEDQIVEGYFRGDEMFSCENLHAEKPRLTGKLPGLAARFFITQRTKEGDAFREIATRIDTVHLFPHKERAVAIFRGMVEIGEDDAADVISLVAALEEMGAPRPVEHYQAVLAKRLDKRGGAVEGLRDTDLMPPRREGAPKDRFSDMEELVARDRLLAQNQRRKAQKQLDSVRAELEARGIDPDDHLPKEAPEEAVPPADTDDLADFIAEQRVLAARAQEEAEGRRKEVEDRLRAECAARDIDYEAIRKKQQRGGPPKFISKAELAVLVDKKGGERDPDLATRLTSAEAQILDAYRRGVHHMPAAERLDLPAAKAVREAVVAALARGESLAERDLTGADLSGLDFAKRDLRNAMLECANLSGSRFDEADLTGAVLARADLTRASFAKAKLLGANLGHAVLRGANLEKADLTRAVLHKADLANASMAGATLLRAKVNEASFDCADLTGVAAAGVVIIKCNLAGAKLAAADLGRGTLLEVDATGVDFTGATMKSCAFVTSKADRAIFRGANLENLRCVKESSLEGADLRGALLDRANLRGTNLKGADLTRARLEIADLSECDCSGATLVGANAAGARFIRTDLRGAKMDSMNLMNAIIQKSLLGGASLEGANLFRADLARVVADDETSLEGANVKQVRVVQPRRPDGQG